MPPLRVSLIAIPEGSISTLRGLYDVLNSFEALAGFDEAIPPSPPFRVEIVATAAGPVKLASGLATQVHRGDRRGERHGHRDRAFGTAARGRLAAGPLSRACCVAR